MNHAQRSIAFVLLGIGISACSLLSSFTSKPTPTPTPTDTSTPTVTVAPSATPSATPTETLEPGKGGGVPSSWKGIPIMPEATNYEEIENGVTYTVTASLSDVDSFYSTKMEDLGWTFIYRDDSTEGYLMLIYQKDSVNAGIGAIEDGDQCLVILGVS